MSGTLTNAKEIYYSFREDRTGTRKVVPVRGVYVTGEWKPPTYIEPILRITEISANRATIADYIETNFPNTSPTTQHLYDVMPSYTISTVQYTTNTMPTQYHRNTTQHLYDVMPSYSLRFEPFIQTTMPTQYHRNTTHHLYDISISGYPTSIPIPTTLAGSQPEPILRLIEVNVNSATITDNV